MNINYFNIAFRRIAIRITMIKKIFLSVLILLVSVAVLGFGFFQYYKSPNVFDISVAGLYHGAARELASESTRTVNSGELIGFKDNYNTHAWLGIPYAKAPVGELRWRAPRKVTSWRDRLEAVDYGSPCVQYWGVLAGVDGEPGGLVGDENCLSLNIWAPRDASTKRKVPTMVWIHGGGNDSGSGAVYQGHHLAGSQDVVVVTINYRLGLLGWFSHESIRSTSDNPEDASGNYGTLDIIQALKWVQDNIHVFGGDPNNVTIFGESAGAKNVYSMMASPLAKNLFHKAIAQSGTVDTTLLTLAEEFPEEPNVKAISGLKNSSSALIELVLKSQDSSGDSLGMRAPVSVRSGEELMRMMRRADARELMRLASENSGSKSGYIRVARVLRDGHVLPKESLLSLFKDPSRYNSVPLITGTNLDEQKVFMVRNPEYIDMKFGFLPQIKDPKRYHTVSDYVSRNWKAGAVDEPAKVISNNGGKPVYAYRFDWDDMMSNFLVDIKGGLGAAHGMEINYVFGDFNGGPPFHIAYSRGNAEGRKKLAKSMMGYWGEFAHTSSPGNGGENSQATWSSWQPTGHNILIFDEENDGGVRLAEVRTNVADIKKQLISDEVISSLKDKCQAYASLFLHGYQTSEFWNEGEYLSLGCDAFPVGSFRQG